MNILEELTIYKKVTERIIEEIRRDANVEELMKKREQILNKITSSEDNREEAIKIYKKLEIDKIDKSFKVAMEEEKIHIKKEIARLHNMRRANQTYHSNMGTVNFLNKKI